VVHSCTSNDETYLSFCFAIKLRVQIGHFVTRIQRINCNGLKNAFDTKKLSRMLYECQEKDIFCVHITYINFILCIYASRPKIITIPYFHSSRGHFPLLTKNDRYFTTLCNYWMKRRRACYRSRLQTFSKA
jgi:hypothetical protein